MLTAKAKISTSICEMKRSQKKREKQQKKREIREKEKKRK